MKKSKQSLQKQLEKSDKTNRHIKRSKKEIHQYVCRRN